MALVSPGVQVSVIDESFYTPAEPGTLPMIFVVSAANKKNGAGTATAAGTLTKNAGVPYLLTSQRDLVDTFGDPIFKTDTSNNPIHGSELNEYGLQAAYSYLGVANRAYVARADVDLAELEAVSTAPGADPKDGTYWFDTSISLWGIQQWNGDSVLNKGQIFTNKVPIVITDTSLVSNTGSLNTNGIQGDIPAGSVGSNGDYAVIATTTLNKIFYRNYAGTWVLVGSSPWAKSWPTIKGTVANTTAPTNANLTINTTTVAVTSGQTAAQIASAIDAAGITGISAAAVDGKLEIYGDLSTSGDKIDIADNSTGSAVLKQFGIFATTDSGTKTFHIPKLTIAKHTQIPLYKDSDTQPRPTGSLWLKTTSANLGQKFVVKKWNDTTKLWETEDVNVYSDNENALFELDRTGGGTNLLTGQIYMKSNVADATDPVGTFTFYRRNDIFPTVITGNAVTANTFTAGAKSITISATDKGSAAFSTGVAVSFTPAQATTDATLLATAINNAGITNVSATVTTDNKIQIKHALGGDIRFTDTNGALTAAGFSVYVSTTTGTPNLYHEPGTDGNTNPLQFQASLWKSLTYTASDNAITDKTANGRLWYSSVVDDVDILVHNGSEFVGYLYDGSSGQSATASQYYNSDVTLQTDPAGPLVGATKPLLQSDGTALVTGDIWIDTTDLENYPKLYKFNGARTDLPIENRWFQIDTSDQTTEEGILFADARYNTTGANSNEAGKIVDLLSSDFVDNDSPDPALYPKGMLLFNLRRSGFNVKKYVRNYVDLSAKNLRFNDQSMNDYFADRWVSESANKSDGSGSFGRISQRKVIVQKLQALVNSNDDIRDTDTRLFNVMSTPGYPELIGEMKSLNYDRGLTAFVIGDSPFRLEANATKLNNWAKNTANAEEDNDDGLVTADPYLAVFYPSGFTSDNFGKNIVVPPSHMMMRTIALSDQVSFPWFAPAGTRRGGITNATSTGFINAEGEFKSMTVNEGMRDTLYASNVNPITFVTGAGLVNFGQKTRQLTASALDRINVARLIIYLRSQLNQLAKPYLFEPNDKITRDEIKASAETLLLELVGLRALFDFIVVCDESNNTPARIDRNELYLDIAVEPVKSVEFIYIPLRLKNTGEIASL